MYEIWKVGKAFVIFKDAGKFYQIMCLTVSDKEDEMFQGVSLWVYEC